MPPLRQDVEMPSHSRMVLLVLIVVICSSFTGGCGLFKISIGQGTEEPLREYTIEGRSNEKILMIPIRGLGWL
jgi:hypothetical protein